MIIITKPQKGMGPDTNLLIFEADSGNLIGKIEPPLKTGGQYDGWVNFWIKDDKLWIGSWSGYEFQLVPESCELLNGRFTK